MLSCGLLFVALRRHGRAYRAWRQAFFGGPELWKNMYGYGEFLEMMIMMGFPLSIGKRMSEIGSFPP